MFLVPTSWRPQVEDHKPLAGLMHLRADREEDSPMVKSQLRNEIPKVVKTTFFAGETWWNLHLFIFFKWDRWCSSRIILHPGYSWFWWVGYGSIPINTISRGMNIHFPAMNWGSLGTRVLTHPQLNLDFAYAEIILNHPCFLVNERWTSRTGRHDEICQDVGANLLALRAERLPLESSGVRYGNPLVS